MSLITFNGVKKTVKVLLFFLKRKINSNYIVFSFHKNNKILIEESEVYLI